MFPRRSHQTLLLTRVTGRDTGAVKLRWPEGLRRERAGQPLDARFGTLLSILGVIVPFFLPSPVSLQLKRDFSAHSTRSSC